MCLETNEAVINLIIKWRSPTMRHVSRTHRVALDWLFDRVYIDTKNQLADMLTKGNFTRDEWNHLLCVFTTSHFSSADCSEVMWKRTQKDSGAERVTAKSRPMMNLVARCSGRAPALLSSGASESLGKPRYEDKILWVHKQRSALGRWDPLYAHTHQATQKGILKRLGLLNSGNLINWLTIERWDSLSAHRKRTNSLLKTMRRILTPKQNQICRPDPDHSCTGSMIKCKGGKTNP